MAFLNCRKEVTVMYICEDESNKTCKYFEQAMIFKHRNRCKFYDNDSEFCMHKGMQEEVDDCED